MTNPLVKIIEWPLNEAGEEFGELEVLLHRPLYPISSYHFQVAENLWRSSWPLPADLAFFKSIGVKHMVNLCEERNQDDEVLAAGFDSAINIPVVDNTPPTLEQAEQFLVFVKDALTDVHCELGRGRTSCMIAYYRVMVEKWNSVAALHEAVNFGLFFPAQKDWILGLKP